MEDIRSEITFWGNAQVFFQRLWGKHGIDNVSMLKNGVTVVRFEYEIGKQEELQGGIYDFDNKPFIVKELNMN